MNRKVWVGLAVIVGIGVVAGAAYLGVNLITSGRFGPRIQMASPGGGGLTLMKNGQRIDINLKPAPELPQSSPDVRGRLVELKDNSLNVNTAAQDPGAPTADSSAASVVEVVVTQDTKIYRDATFDSLQPPPPDGTVQQKVEPYSLAQAAKDGADSVSAWGTKRGERLIADVVVLSRNVIVRKTNNP